jgi:DNA-nicking Smr family endonuclease
MAKAKPERTPPEIADLELWVQVTRTTTPLRLRKRQQTGSAHLEPEQPSKSDSGQQARSETLERPPARAKAGSTGKAPAATVALPGLAHGSTAGLDRRTAERLRRGQLSIEATLDLHGHTQEEGHRALNAFIDSAWRAGRRSLLVITGKGRSGEGAGVLRASVPRWLNADPLRPRILAFAAAQPKHGGGGALYILLRRQR